jgi:hypothetical protein
LPLLQGFGEVWSANSTVLKCVELPSSDKRSTIIVAVISAVAGLALLSAVLLVAQLYMRTRPKWLREHIMEAKRKQGAPRCRTRGEKVHVSIVVTDVKDYTALTREQPEAMNRAIGVHNNILRKVSSCMDGLCYDASVNEARQCVRHSHNSSMQQSVEACLPELGASQECGFSCVVEPGIHLHTHHMTTTNAKCCRWLYVIVLATCFLLLFVLQACHTHAGYVLDQVRRLQQHNTLLSPPLNDADIEHTPLCRLNMHKLVQRAGYAAGFHPVHAHDAQHACMRCLLHAAGR